MQQPVHTCPSTQLLAAKLCRHRGCRAAQCLFRNRCGQMDLPPGTAEQDVAKFDGRYTLTVGSLNAKLDELVLVGGGRGAAPHAAEQAAERRVEKGGQAVMGRKAAVLAELMQLTTPRQMRWIVQIILGNLKARL